MVGQNFLTLAVRGAGGLQVGDQSLVDVGGLL
jgi:hypothetical protein